MLLDTSGLLCLHYKSEPFHTQATESYREAKTRLTHNYIAAEYVALANARRFPRQPVIEFVQDLIDSPEIATVWVDQAIHAAAIDLLLKRQDKAYSLCDAVSFVLMHQRGITAALTTDYHFEQEGFSRLLKL
jgi:uncharacterized protein